MAGEKGKQGPKGPTKMTEEKKKEFLEALKVGASQQDACNSLDIDRETVRRHAIEDEKFAEGIRTAAAKGKILHLKRVYTAGQGYQASCWFLSRKYWKEWAERKPETLDTEDVMALITNLVTYSLSYVHDDRKEEYRQGVNEIINVRKGKKRKK